MNTESSPNVNRNVGKLQWRSVYFDSDNVQFKTDKTIDLGDEHGKIPSVTIGDSAFPRFSWLVKNFNCNTNDERKRYYNIKMDSGRVTENCYGMLKSRWRILYRKAESKVFNLKYIIMACVMLHNFCIAKLNPCNPRWRLSVEKLELNNTVTTLTGYGRKLNLNV